MHERSAKLLTQRSRSAASASKITTHELTNLGFLASIFAQETKAKCGKLCTGFQLSLQGIVIVSGFT